MFGFLRRLMGGGEDDPAGSSRRSGKTFEGELEIDIPTYAIGDVHGRDDLLSRLLDAIRDDAAAQGHGGAWRLVMMGDYIDRGEDSARVMARIRALQEQSGGPDGPADVIALRGNHEEMMVGFVEEPARGERWLRNGGLQTLMSYGVRGVTAAATPEEMTVAAESLVQIAAEDLAQIRAMPAWVQFGTVIFCHAGADPELPPDMQSERTLTWGTTRFFQLPRKDGNWIVYGHYVVDEAGVSQGRIALDTGAYHSGILSAVRLDGPEPHFLTT